MEILERFNSELDRLHKGGFCGQLRRGLEPTGVEIYFHALDEGIELRGVDLEGIPPQLRLQSGWVKTLDPKTNEWVEFKAPALKTFLLLDPRVYKNQLTVEEVSEKLLPGMYVFRASYYASKLLSLDGKQLLPEETINWLKEWDQDKRQISFVMTSRYELVEMSQADVPPYFDPKSPYNLNFMVTVSFIGHRTP